MDEAHNLPGRAREMHSAALTKTSFYEAKKLLGKGKSSLKNALTKVMMHLLNGATVPRKKLPPEMDGLAKHSF